MNDQIMQELNSSAWNEINPTRCPCRHGWLLSDFDTWHRCHEHGQGVPHPEDDDTGFNVVYHTLAMFRKAYKTYRDIAVHFGFRGNFNEAVRSIMDANTSPAAWVESAEVIAEQAKAWHERVIENEQKDEDDYLLEQAEYQQLVAWTNWN